VPGTCTDTGHVCCNLEADEISVAGNEFYIDADAGSDTNDGTSPQTTWQSLSKISSVGSGAVVNLKRGAVWNTSGAIHLTDVTVRPHDQGPRPVINGTDIVVPQSLGTIVLKGNAILDVVEDVQMHHNLCVDTVGLFESCQGTGDPGFNPTENPGTIRDITVAYNVVLDSKWMYLAQLVNTIHENVVFEHNTIIHGPRNDTQ